MPGGAHRVTHQAERHDRDQADSDQERRAAPRDARLGPGEALGAEPAIEQRARHRAADRVAEQAGDQPADHHQRQPRPEAVDEAGRRVDDLGRVEDDAVDHGEGKDQQRPAEAEAFDLVADLGGVPLDRRIEGVVQLGHRHHQAGEQRDAGQGRSDRG
jgi:hypothetical protein